MAPGCIKSSLIKSIALENRLTLYLYDNSKRIVGDRCLVSFQAVIEIPINDATVGDSEIDINEIRKALGESICFRQSRARNFISKTAKETILRELVNSFLNTSSSYLSHIDFPKKVVEKEYRNYLKRKSWCTQSEPPVKC
jgi:hypothetical protein